MATVGREQRVPGLRRRTLLAGVEVRVRVRVLGERERGQRVGAGGAGRARSVLRCTSPRLPYRHTLLQYRTPRSTPPSP
eukprot:2586032-Rhodomonas_salina.2